MLDQVLTLFSIQPDHDLDIMEPDQDLFDVTCAALKGLRNVIKTEAPDLILVHGDTTTTMAASLAAYYCHVPVGHVEAGLRTGNKNAPFPEEINRRVTDTIADIHFAPTDLAKKNLLREGIPDSHIHVTGNTIIDSLQLIVQKTKSDSLEKTILNELHKTLSETSALFRSNNSRFILVTGHRRENFGIGFENICMALADIAAANPDVDIIYPVHLNPNVKEPVYRILGLTNHPNIHLIEPLDYISFVYLMTRSYFIITDSGGIQEEAPALGKPVLVMRSATERPEAIIAGTAKLVGCDRQKIVAEIQQLLDNPLSYNAMSRAHNPYGDGNAAQRIVDIINTDLQSR